MGQGDSHKYTIHDVPELRHRRYWKDRSVNRAAAPEARQKSVRTVFPSDRNWIVVVHHPGTKLEWNDLGGWKRDGLGERGL